MSLFTNVSIYYVAAFNLFFLDFVFCKSESSVVVEFFLKSVSIMLKMSVKKYDIFEMFDLLCPGNLFFNF